MSVPASDLERWSRAWREPPPGTAATPGCPDAATLSAAAAGESAPAARRAVMDHVAACPACVVAWRLARDLAATAPPRRVSTVPIRLVVAAAVLLTALLVGGPRRGGATADAGWRTAPAAVDWSAVTSGSVLPLGRFTLRWPAGPPGSRYEVRVLTPALDAIDRASGLDRAEYTVPPAALAAVPAATHLLWRVEVVLPGGRREASPTFEAVLEGAEP